MHLTNTSVILAALLSVVWAKAKAQYTEKEAPAFLKKVNANLKHLESTSKYKEWDYKTTLTDQAAKDLATAKENYNLYLASVWPEASKFPWKSFSDPVLKRQFFYLSQLDEAAISPDDRTKLSDVINNMLNVYGTAKVREYKSTNTEATLNYNDVSPKFPEDFLDACEMSFYWEGWHNTVGRAEKPYFQQYVELINKVAQANNFTDNAARWQSKFETENLEQVCADLATQIDPLVKQVHAYVRRKLWEAHGKDSSIIDLEGPIPASLLGSIWGMDGISIYSITAPFPDVPSVDVSPQLKAQNYTGLKMAKTAEKFFLSLGLSKMTEKFWKDSIFERPAGVDIDCDEESYDFYNGRDYRIKYCTIPTLEDLGGIHHEMGTIENFMAWKDLPYLLQRSPNEGFTDSLGELLNQYVTCPTHLKSLGLLDANWQSDKKQELNYLQQQALYDILFLPYAYSLDLWRWRIFQGKITPENYNCEYWNIRSQLQGVAPPVDRGQQDFDAGAKHQVDNDEEYVKYFLNVILQYQLHRALCIEAGQFDPNNPDSKPLYLCDISGNQAAGEKLKQMMSLGASKTWQDALEIITGQRKIDATALLQFFQPLYDWLKAENEKNNEKIGWTSGKVKFCEKEVSPGTGPCRY
ncbi:angiotensin-converting enzyme-like [Macrosteles quadrilineatus]|uniref:angiotensin-converting enzyme-like n=1 Tax=Macrosteles quadrilineatus TaxID=74068 RepID=UPI0023E0F3FF|nr:angiotensin-converting enzyme-like [Macrosteles quadrilineatus]